MSMATYSSHTLPSRGGGGGGGRFYGGSAGLMEKIHEMLTERECSIFNEGLAAYHKRRDVSRFVESLSLVLNTNGKRQLLVPIRNQFIKPSDLIKFNDLSIKYGIALPLKGNTAKSGKKMFNKTQTGPKVLEIKRDEKGEWGFSIRGGIDHGIGIFVSWVDRGSNAEKAGLKVGDYIHRVNEVGLEGLTFAQATQIFRNRSKIRMVITSYGRIPGFQFANKSFRWVDREGKPVLPPTEIESLGMTSGGHVDPNVRKVSFTVESGQVLGISIRGGAEHGLGIYVSEVDAESVAETNGIKRGEQILEVNGISYINILHPDAAKGLKEERVMTMRLKDVGKLPHSKIPPVAPQTWQQEPSVAASQTTRSMRSLPGTMKKSTEYTDSSKPAEGTGGTPVMITKRALTPGRGIMNEVAESLLTKSEMTTFTYYITRYEHNQISVESLVESLLKLLNTEKKMSLIGEVRNIIREKDLDLYNELTAQKELQSFRASKSLYDSDDDMAAVHAINGIKTPQKGFNDDDSLDDVPQRFQTVPITIHPPPPPPREGDTSTPHLIATSMKDRRHNLHESILEDDSWEDSTLPRPLHTKIVDDDTMKRKIKEIEEKTKLELEEQLKREYEEQLAEKLRAEQEEIERIKEEMRLEKEEMEKQLQNLSGKEGEEGIDKEKLEEEIWKQAEESLRQELTNQIEKESEQKLKEEYDKLLETSLAEERKKTEAERKMREELEKKQRDKNVIEREREEQKRIEIEDRARRDAEDKARREYEQRLQRESEEKARLAEEIKSYRSMKMEMESERDQKERLEKAKKNAERKAEEEEAEKERIRKKLKKEKEEAEERAEKEEAEKRKIEKQLKREKEDAEEKAEREAAEKLKLKALLEKKEKELEEKEREHAEREAALQAQQKKQSVKQQKVKPVQQVMRQEAEAEEEPEDEEGMEEDEEEELRRQEEEELRRQEEEEERRREEERQREEKRKQQERKKAKQEEERRRRQQERELARQAEEERLRRMREEEEKQKREEEERRQREEEEEIRMREEEERRQMEEEEEERKRMEERRLSKEGSFFDPVLMDELVISSLPSQAPAPASSSASRPHVTFQDQKKKEQKIIENERKLAEQMLAVRLREKKNESKEEEGRFSFAGYTNLKGTMTKVTVKKVNKKLGIAVDGGSNTKQKAVIVRQIVPDGSAALTGKDLEIGQQILAVNGKSLKGLKHKDAVLAIKNAFDGPMQKVIEFDMLIPDTS